MSTLGEVVLRDVYANLPAASIPGRLFFATDTGIAYRDNGATWDSVGASAINFADGEVVSGSGTAWTLAHTPNPVGSLQLFQRLTGSFGSVKLDEGTGADFTISGNAITTINSLTAGDLTAWYRY